MLHEICVRRWRRPIRDRMRRDKRNAAPIPCSDTPEHVFSFVFDWDRSRAAQALRSADRADRARGKGALGGRTCAARARPAVLSATIDAKGRAKPNSRAAKSSEQQFKH